MCRCRVSRAASQLLASGTARVASSQYRSVTENSSASEDLINMSIKMNEPGATGQPEGHMQFVGNDAMLHDVSRKCTNASRTNAAVVWFEILKNDVVRKTEKCCAPLMGLR